MERAFTITRLGFNLIAKWGAGAERIIESVWVGSGRYEEGQNLAELEDLITPVAQATSTVPQTVDSQIQFIIEYRNDLEPALNGFWLNEYGIFAEDPDLGRIMLCYGTLGDKPEWVAPFASGEFNRRAYPISIGVSGDGEVTLSYPANAFMTAEEVSTFFQNAAIQYMQNMIELSENETPAVGTKLHYHILPLPVRNILHIPTQKEGSET